MGCPGWFEVQLIKELLGTEVSNQVPTILVSCDSFMKNKVSLQNTRMAMLTNLYSIQHKLQVAMRSIILFASVSSYPTHVC